MARQGETTTSAGAAYVSCELQLEISKLKQICGTVVRSGKRRNVISHLTPRVHGFFKRTENPGANVSVVKHFLPQI